ncbi:hypothetical protein VF21_09388 [Pseudogymnoascus sp. 05NY08]|nr:hypothetical protein VF21_09388 [Pseudogymnoascus sp. 05NY08]
MILCISIQRHKTKCSPGLRKLWPSTHATHRDTAETTEATGNTAATKTTKEAPPSHPAPPTDATIDIRGTAISLDPASLNHISEHFSESSNLSCSNPGLGADAGTPLLNLPPEIRHQIWAEILSNHTIHLEVAKGSLRGTECIAPDPSKCHDAPFTRGCQAAGGLERRQGKKPGGKLEMLPLLLTCKLIHPEAINIIYTTKTFIIRHLTTLHSLPSLLPPHHLNSIRTLLFITGISLGTNHSILPPRRLPGEVLELDDDYVSEWAVAWRILSKMHGLRALDVLFQPVNHAGFFSRSKSREVALEKAAGGEEGGRFSLHLPKSKTLWWRSTVARSALAAMEGVYKIEWQDGAFTELPEWAK